MEGGDYHPIDPDETHSRGPRGAATPRRLARPRPENKPKRHHPSRVVDELLERIDRQQRELDELRREVGELREGEAREAPAGSTPEDEAADPVAYAFGDIRKPVLSFRVAPLEKPTGRYTISIGGHLNRAVNTSRDGDKTKALFVDNGNVPTFLNVKTSAKLHEELTIRTHIEYGLQQNAATQASQTNESAGFNTSGRFFELVADSPSYGRLSFGKGFASSFLLLEADLSGQQAFNLASVGNTAGGLRFYDNDTNTYSARSVGGSFVDLQELALINRVRYDSPSWAGLQLSGTVGENDFRDVTLRFKRTFAGIKLVSGASYQDKAQGAFSVWRWSGATSLWHEASGFNVTGGGVYQKSKDDRRKSHGYTLRLGWRKRLWEIGETKATIDYQKAWDITQDGSKEVAYGAFLSQGIDRAGLELYSGYRLYHLDIHPEDLDNVHVFTMGASFAFDLNAIF